MNREEGAYILWKRKMDKEVGVIQWKRTMNTEEAYILLACDKTRKL